MVSRYKSAAEALQFIMDNEPEDEASEPEDEASEE